jgi:malate synthase
MPTLTDRIQLTHDHPASTQILTDQALAFLLALHERFEPKRQELLAARQARQAAIDAGTEPDFLPETAAIRAGDWQVAPVPADLQDRRVEITGPCERKMMINALNSGAKVFMADCEDAQSPTWANQLRGQVNLIDAVRKQIRFADSAKGKTYELADQIATLLVRPRGWHLPERHLLIDGQPMSGSLFDCGLYLFHNAQERLARGETPAFYLPKLEHHLEARLWNEVFIFAQEYLGIPAGSIRATVLIETIHAAYQMDEILHELKDHICGLNAGRWDYIFSCIKTNRQRRGLRFADRGQVGMTVPFMHAYTELLVRTCHKRGAHAIGGMSAFIPNRRDPAVTERALKQVRADKQREVGQGCDGTWVAHPDLVAVAQEAFDQQLGEQPHQKQRRREEVAISAEQLRDFSIPNGRITESGMRENITIGLHYLCAWLNGNGAAAINNLMEDVATAEISRSMLWLWRREGVMSEAIYRQLRDDELTKLAEFPRIKEAAKLLDDMVLREDFPDFLTLPAYEILD